MDLRAVVLTKLLENKVIPELKKQWDRLHHNATLLYDMPDYDEEEAEFFWDWLKDVIHFGVEDMTKYIQDTWELDWSIYQWGRSGATIAPDCYYKGFEKFIYSFGLMNDGLVVDIPEGPEDLCASYKGTIKALAALKYINEEVNRGVKSIKFWWEEYKNGTA